MSPLFMKAILPNSCICKVQENMRSQCPIVLRFTKLDSYLFKEFSEYFDILSGCTVIVLWRIFVFITESHAAE